MKEERSTIPIGAGETVSSVFTIPDDYAAGTTQKEIHQRITEKTSRWLQTTLSKRM